MWSNHEFKTDTAIKKVSTVKSGFSKQVLTSSKLSDIISKLNLCLNSV